MSVLIMALMLRMVFISPGILPFYGGLLFCCRAPLNARRALDDFFLSFSISLNIFTIFVVVFCSVAELQVLRGLCDFIFVLFDFLKFIWLFAALGSKDWKTLA